MALTNLWGTLTNRRSRRSGRAAHQNLLKPPFRWHRLPLRMESLEDRIAPDATPLELTLASQDPAAVTLRLNGSDLQVVPTADPGAPPLASRALADVSEVRIFGDPAKPEAVTIDYAFGGFFWVPGGTSFQGGA